MAQCCPHQTSDVVIQNPTSAKMRGKPCPGQKQLDPAFISIPYILNTLCLLNQPLHSLEDSYTQRCRHDLFLPCQLHRPTFRIYMNCECGILSSYLATYFG